MSIVKLKQQLSEHSRILSEHKIYDSMNNLEDFKIFMSHHVWAVWDFMSILKSLQIQLTGLSLPWVPSKYPECAALINRIVVEEESDVDLNGQFKSHFQMYLESMQDLGVDTSLIDCLIGDLNKGVSWKISLSSLELPSTVYDFVSFHLDLVEKAPLTSIAAVFALSREDLVPVMFERILENHPHLEDISPSLKYYLERHVELDGGEHSELAEQMLVNLCGEESHLWEQAFTSCAQAMELRIKLWDGVLKDLQAQQPNFSKSIVGSQVLMKSVKSIHSMDSIYSMDVLESSASDEGDLSLESDPSGFDGIQSGSKSADTLTSIEVV